MEGQLDPTDYMLEEQTGLSYAKARYYDVENGRFISKDRYLGDRREATELNRYTYARNNPIRYCDPSGKFVITAMLTVSATSVLVNTLVDLAVTAVVVKVGYDIITETNNRIDAMNTIKPGEKRNNGKTGQKFKGKGEISNRKTESNNGDSNKKSTPEMIAAIVSQIPNSLKQLGKCDQFARAFVQKLKSTGIVYQIIRVESTYGIYSDKVGKNIGLGYYYGIRIGNIVYDNLTTAGLEFGKWLADLGADGSFADISWKIVNEILSR